MKKNITIMIIVLSCLAVLGIALVAGVNFYVKHIGGENILSPENAKELNNIDCIIVLGCQVKNGGEPSAMLEDRLNRGIELYKNGVAPKMIMSGDHGTKSYDEVNAMKDVAIAAGVPSEDVFMDHAGFSTYETVYRAKEIFNADKVIIVTQEYHLYRALYIAKQLGIEAYGVNADYHTYLGQVSREAREILARCKDFVKTIFKPEPTFLGEVIPVSGNGDITND